jgi:hypothetical protein
MKYLLLLLVSIPAFAFPTAKQTYKESVKAELGRIEQDIQNVVYIGACETQHAINHEENTKPLEKLGYK